MKTIYSAKMVKNGNIKLGNSMWSFNKLAGAGEICGCKGTCGEHCKGCYNAESPKKSNCYVFKSYVTYGWEKSTVVKAHIRNTNAIRGDIDSTFKDIRAQLKRAKKKPSAVRIHSSGELETVEELINWIETARMFPEIPFYIYTKNYAVVDNVLTRSSMRVPNNFFINISIWHESGIETYQKFSSLDCVRAFVYDDGYDYGKRLKISCYCPAYDEKGKLHHDLTCDKCRICFQNKAKVCACHSH